MKKTVIKRFQSSGLVGEYYNMVTDVLDNEVGVSVYRTEFEVIIVGDEAKINQLEALLPL